MNHSIFRILKQQYLNEQPFTWCLASSHNLDNCIQQKYIVFDLPTTFFHISDTHLGYRNRSKPGGRGNSKWVDRTDSIGAFESVVQMASKEGIDAVIHTGDLFDHNVDQDTIEAATSAIKTLTDNKIPFYFILGDHDRLATGGTVPWAANAITALESLHKSGMVHHCDTTGNRLKGNKIKLFGLDAAKVGFKEIQDGFSLKGSSPNTIEFETSVPGHVNILCMHEPLNTLNLSHIINSADRQGQPLDIILLGHEHSPPFKGQWQTTIEGVSIAYAGPTIPISPYFNSHNTGYNRIRISVEGNISIDRRELSEDLI